MVKRTLVVLGILVMSIMAVGTSNAQLGGWPGEPSDCGPAYPLFVPVCCPPQVEYQQVIKTWSCKIEGPCPPPGMPMGCCEKKKKGIGSLLSLVGAVTLPCEGLFGGFGGVHGCNPKSSDQGPCGPTYGRLPGFFAAGPAAIGSQMFDTLW